MKKRKAKQVPSSVPSEIMNEASFMVKNGLSEAIMGFNPGGMGVELSQADTLFKNNRWYLISNMRQLISEIYVEIGLVSTIVDVPIDDALRGGLEVKSHQLNQDQLDELRIYLDRKNIIGGSIGQAGKWNRLFGGAAILILTDQLSDTPLDIDEIKEDTPLEFRAIDMWELYFSRQNTEDRRTELSQAGTQGDKLKEDVEFYDYYGKKVHKSRVIILKGIIAPSFVRPRLRGWGLSVAEILVRSINQYLKSADLAFEVLDEFKLDIYKLKNLATTLMSPLGEAQVRKRLSLMNQQKNFQNAIAMDGEDDFQQKQLTFSGLAEVMNGIRIQVASDMRMPLTKIFGLSAAGFNSGEDDLEVYNGMIESQVREKLKHPCLRVLEICCQSLFGYIPDDLEVDFKPLRVLSAEQEENVKNHKLNRLILAYTNGMISAKEFKDACNKENLLCVQVSATDSVLDMGSEDGDEGDDTEEAPTAKAPPPSKAPEPPKPKNSLFKRAGLK